MALCIFCSLLLLSLVLPGMGMKRAGFDFLFRWPYPTFLLLHLGCLDIHGDVFECTHGGVLNLHTVGFSACRTTTTRQHTTKHNTQQSTTQHKAAHSSHTQHNTARSFKTYTWATQHNTTHLIPNHTRPARCTPHQTHPPTHQHHRPTPTQVIYLCSFSFATFSLLISLCSAVFSFF